MKQKITKELTINETLETQIRSMPKELNLNARTCLGYVSQNSRLARRIKAGKTNGKKYNHIEL
jgi:hypothetical protein